MYIAQTPLDIWSCVKMCQRRVGRIAKASVGRDIVAKFVVVSKEETTAKITHLWPTATFTIKVIATAGDKEHSKVSGVQSSAADSDDSEIFYCDTAVGSCAPKKRKCLGLCQLCEVCLFDPF